MLEKRYQTNSVEETYLFGEALGESLTKGDILALQGSLGAGKTTLTHGIAQGLGIWTPISSPTFTLLFEHPAGERSIPLFHFDAYRLRDETEWYDAGFDEYLDGSGVVVIEWADRIKNLLPENTIWLLLEAESERPEQRKFTLKQNEKRKDFSNQLTVWEI